MFTITVIDYRVNNSTESLMSAVCHFKFVFYGTFSLKVIYLHFKFYEIKNINLSISFLKTIKLEFTIHKKMPILQ